MISLDKNLPNLVFLALMWLPDPTANAKSISRDRMLLVKFGPIFYVGNFWAESLQPGR